MPEIISIETAKKLARNDIARLIDHTALRSDVSIMEIETLCKEALQYNFYSVCINASLIPVARLLLKDSKTKICTVVGFPLGATLSRVKACEAEQSAIEGAQEIDMVLNISALKDKDYKKVEEEIKMVVEAVSGLICKVILENCLLTDEEKEVGCKIVVQAGAHFVKTSTGFEKSGATTDDIKLMRRVVGKYAGVKAAGAIRDYETALKMVDAGATRIGASKGVQIVEGSHL